MCLRFLPGTLAPLYQDLQAGVCQHRWFDQCSGVLVQSLGLRLRLDAIPGDRGPGCRNTLGDPFHVLFQRGNEIVAAGTSGRLDDELGWESGHHPSPR